MIPFLDLHKINDRFKDQFHISLNENLNDSQFILGPAVSKFENEFADFCGTRYCIGVGNGLDALTLILKGYIQLGRLSLGDKVIVPANTFIATILSVIHAGLEPVLVEPDPKTYNISAYSISDVLDDDIKAIIVVHLYGQLADLKSIKELTKTRDLIFIEDAAQAHGASNENGIAGNLANAAAFSFYPSKNLGALGDGGAITTNDEQLHNKVRMLSNYGSKEKYKNQSIGYNSRLDVLQASFLSVKLNILHKDNERRQDVAKRYINEIVNPKIKLPYYNNSNNHVFYAFVVEVSNRSEFINYLNSNNIGWLIHYPIPPHKQDALKRFSKLEFPITETLCDKVISLPMSPVLSDKEVDTLVQILNAY
ncbi:DegT/DnrJ/EryC1/StrS family aminotransferase [Winogradskyella poriferorum]|uniref:DegT/DnrJ/EryC1/StrS family aminotransferase n=1 Tax=Winogradskyella poriferorum TaxID=307627 RepID=UPI003D645C0A